MAFFRFQKKAPVKADAGDKIRCIKVLGTGCSSCHALYANAQAAAKAMGLSLEVAYITDLQAVMAYGVMRLPALVVNENVVSAGKVLTAADIQKLLTAIPLTKPL